jgi:predicted nucleic acid-binding protein
VILVDTSVWIDHFRRGNDALVALLDNAEVFCHPFIVGELACGHLGSRSTILEMLNDLPDVPSADHAEVLTFIERHRLMGSGIGWVDAHLLTSTLMAGTALWTLDQPLARAARKLAVMR